MFQRIALGLTLALTAAPISAAANTTGSASAFTDRQLTLTTELTPTVYGAGSFVGDLHLHVYPDGIVNGYYRDLDGGIGPVNVEGGIDGNDAIWLDIGRNLHIVGTYDAATGAINGSTYFHQQPWQFTGKSGG